MSTRLRPAPTAESVLASNAYLNPLLGSGFGSVRALSTSASHRAGAILADTNDLYQEETGEYHLQEEHRASKESKRVASVNKGEYGRDIAKSTTPSRVKAIQKQRLDMERPIRSHAENQTVEQSHLLRDLSTPTAAEAEHQDGTPAHEHLTPAALRSRLADLEARLTAAEAVDWTPSYRDAESEGALTDLPNYKSMHHGKQLRVAKELRRQYEARTKEIRKDEMEHKASMEQLRNSVNMLKGYIQHTNTSSEAAGAQAGDNSSSQHQQALDDFKKRRQELLKKKDELAIRLAQLRGGKQPGSSSSPTPSPHSDTTPNTRSLPNFDTRSLRLHMPGNKLKIDDSLTIDLSPNVSIKQLQNQLKALQARLRTFHPPLDELPLDIQPKGKPAAILGPYMLRKLTSILVSRYQTKTGVFGEPVEDAKEVRAVNIGELSPEAKERMAKRWNEMFGAKKGFLMRGDETQPVRNEVLEQSETRRVGQHSRHEEDNNEVGFLEDKHATEQGLARETTGPERTPSPQSATAVLRQEQLPKAKHPQTQPLLRPISFAHTEKRAYSTSTRNSDTLNAALGAKERAEALPAKDPPPHSPPQDSAATPPSLPHLTPSGSAHMVSISLKPGTPRTAIAVGTVFFSNPTPLSLIASNSLKKGDVLSVSRIAGIMAAKKCPEIVPLCHPILLTHVGVELRTFGDGGDGGEGGSGSGEGSESGEGRRRSPDDMRFGGVQIECVVACAGSTGVEMEALTAVMGTALSVVDMCKAVDRFQRIGEVRVVLKEGGKSGVWREEGWVSWQKGQ